MSGFFQRYLLILCVDSSNFFFACHLQGSQVPLANKDITSGTHLGSCYISPMLFQLLHAQRTVRHLFTRATTDSVWTEKWLWFKTWRSPSLMKPGLGSGIIILLDGFRPRIKSPIYPNLIQHRWLGSSSEAPNACSNITSLATSVRTAHWKSRWQIREEKKNRY